MRLLILTLFFCFPFQIFAQIDDLNSTIKKDTLRKSLRDKPKENPKATIDQYRIISLERDTTYIDTSLTIKKDYNFNFLRKDNFGLLAFANDAQTYNTLDFSTVSFKALPDFGFKAKHFNYLKPEEINYYSVATPITELYFKTVLEQGQSIDAFLTLNASKNFNFSIAYKGLRSLGKYLNSLSSSGNFKFTASYHSKDNRYHSNFHYTFQDLLNGENGGISNLSEFTSGNNQFIDRTRLSVFFNDAKSYLEGKRYFLNHSLILNPSSKSNIFSFAHQLIYESKRFEFNSISNIKRFGESYISANYIDLTKFNLFSNEIGFNFMNNNAGKIGLYFDNSKYNYTYESVIRSNNQIKVPNLFTDSFESLKADYVYSQKKINGKITYSKSVSNEKFSSLELTSAYTLNEKNSINAKFTNFNKIPDLNYTLYQSSFINYNWFHSFDNEKINQLEVNLTTKWLSIKSLFSSLDNFLYFSNDSVSDEIIITTPKQYKKNIVHASIQLSKEFKFKKFSLDNTILYQEVSQENNILNVPKILTRNTLYYTDYLFKKALFLQTGITFQAFSSYYSNAYNPLIGEFYVQEKTKIGNYPFLDFFINARVRQARIFLKAEHLNDRFTGRNYFSAPNQPYKDFVIRFGLVWTFFQ